MDNLIEEKPHETDKKCVAIPKKTRDYGYFAEAMCSAGFTPSKINVKYAILLNWLNLWY